MKPINTLKKGEQGLIKKITGGPRFIQRALSMGFSIDTGVQMIRNTWKGPVIVFVQDSEIALGRQEAGNILVA